MPRNFLKNYVGTLVTDGDQVYHKIAEERPNELKVAGCWAHCKRKFDDVLKALKTTNPKGTISAEAHKRIAAIYHDIDTTGLDKSGGLYGAIRYALNREPYLRTFVVYHLLLWQEKGADFSTLYTTKAPDISPMPFLSYIHLALQPESC